MRQLAAPDCSLWSQDRLGGYPNSAVPRHGLSAPSPGGYLEAFYDSSNADPPEH